MSEDAIAHTNETTDVGQFFSSLAPGDTVRVAFLDSGEETAANFKKSPRDNPNHVPQEPGTRNINS